MVEEKRKTPLPKVVKQPLTAEEAGPMPVVDEALISDCSEADVVILGLGHGGMQCALAAAEGGASVIAIDRKPEKGFRWMGEQIGTFNSKFFIDRGYGPYNLDEVILEFMKSGGYYVNQSVITTYVRNSGEMLDHMIGLVPKDSTLLDEDQFSIQCGYGDEPYPRERGGIKSWPGPIIFRGTLIDKGHIDGLIGSDYFVNELSRLSELEDAALTRAKELGASFVYSQTGIVLDVENGAVTGVITKDADGNYHRYRARKGVVLATGDGNNGGMNLGLWAGGVIEDVPVMAAGPDQIAKAFGQIPFLHLNSDGRRFVNEGIPYAIAYAAYRQPKGIICCVFDSKWEEQIKFCGNHHGDPDFSVPLYFEQTKADMEFAVTSEVQPVGIRSLSTSEREQWPVYAANSLEELADLLGYEGEARENWFRSIERYNELCYKKHDDDFGKDARALIPIDKAPFYAACKENRRGAVMGGPGINKGFMVSSELQVLDDVGKPISGLYAAGNTIGGRHALFYPTPVGGNYIGMAMTLGRVLGKKLTGQETA